jgi:hypothetical protein
MFFCPRFEVAMRPWLLACSLLFVALCLASQAVAEETALLPVPPAPAPWEIATPCPFPVVPVAEAPKPDPLFATGPHQLFDLDILIGLPTAVRFGGAIFRGKSCAFLLEGIAGVDLIVPLAGAGARFRFAPWYGERNAFVLKPGVDGYFLVNPLGFYTGTTTSFVGGADVECLWFHNCGCCGWELGVDLGILFTGATAGHLFPLVSFIAGIRF